MERIALFMRYSFETGFRSSLAIQALTGPPVLPCLLPHLGRQRRDVLPDYEPGSASDSRGDPWLLVHAYCGFVLCACWCLWSENGVCEFPLRGGDCAKALLPGRVPDL